MVNLNKRIKGILIFVLFILLIPFIAMQFTNAVKWTLSDFIIAGILIIGTAFLLDLVIRKVNKKRNQVIYYVVIIAILLLIWTELAVGIIGTPLAGS